MTDPLQGASAALQGIQKLQNTPPAQEVSKGPGTTEGPSFKEVMNQKAGKVDPAQNDVKIQAQEPLPATQKSESAQRLDKFVRGVFKDEDRINNMMQKCTDGKVLKQEELLQLQALIYSYGQKIDLASKVVDKATGGVKQIMNTQV